MTAQIAETLRYMGEETTMCGTPLDSYFAMVNIEPGFACNCTALWRGYHGTWEITHDRLYLIALEAELENGVQASLTTFFPGFPDRVFAHWYSGILRIPQGQMLEYVHMGYESTFERDLFLDVEQGVVVATRIVDNSVAANAQE